MSLGNGIWEHRRPINKEDVMNALQRLLGTALMAASLAVPAMAWAESTVTTGRAATTSGTYMDYMKTVYDRAGAPEITSLPLTEFDGEFKLNPMGAKSWTQSGGRPDLDLQAAGRTSSGAMASRSPPRTMSSRCSAPPRRATTSTGTGRSPAASRAGPTSPTRAPIPPRSASRPSTPRRSKSPPTRRNPASPASPASGTRCRSMSSTRSATTMP